MNPLRTAAGSGLGLLLAGSLLTGAPGALAAPDDTEVRAPGARQADPAPARAVRAAPSATTETVASERVVPEPPASYPSQPQLKVFPDDPADASNARGAVPYDEIAPELQRQMRRSDAVSTQVVGQSTQGRDIYLVTVTAPETAAQTAQQTAWREAIRETPEAAADDAALQAGYKTPIWFNGNIHGNEWEGADMTLNYIDDVVTAYTSEDRDTRLEALELLRGHRLYFTVTNNPDGRVNGTRATALGLDPNRDFITNTTPETTLIRDLTDDIQPLFFSDLHGYTGNLQVEPTGPPHGENYDYDLFIPHAYASALAIEEAVVEADIEGNPLTPAGGILIPYRDIPSGWDDWPPIFTAQYVAFHGAVTSTVELPLGRSGDQPARTAINNQVGAVVMDVTVDYVDANADELLDNQIETFRRGAAGEPIEPILDPSTVPGPTQWQSEWDADGGEAYAADLPRGYVIPAGEGQRSESDAAALVDFLIAHGIELSRATSDFTVGGTTYEAGSYVVDLHQPLRGLANSLLDAGSDISGRVATMYDVSAWAPGLIWGATTAPFGETTDADLPVATTPVDAAAPESGVPAQGGLLALDLLGGAEVRALNQVLEADVPVTWLPSGTAVLGADDASYAAATAAARDQQVAFRAVGADVLDTEGAKGLDDVTVGFTGAADDRLALGQMGFTDLVPLTSAGLTSGAIDLADVDLLYIGSSLTFAADQAAGANAIRAFLAEGKGMIGRGSAASTFATTFGLLTATAVTGNGRGTGIVGIDTPEGSVLEPVAQPYGFVAPATWFINLGANADVAATYGAGNPLVSGHWNTNGGTLGPTSAAGQAAVVTNETRRGNKAMVFGVLPTYRTYTRGAYSQLGHGLFWAAPTVEGVQPPEEPEPPVDPDPVAPELGMTLAQNPIRVGQQPRARVELDLGGADVEEVTLQIRKAGKVITTRTVRRDGSFVIGFPRQSAGQHRIRAVVLPTDATTRAASPVRVLRVQRN